MSGIVKDYESLIGGFGGVAVTTFTPTLDGLAGRENVNESWSAKRAAAGNVSAYGATTWGIRMSASTDTSNRWRTFRPAMCLFDTSAIGSGTIISATFQVALNNKTDDFNDSMSLVNATPASNTAFANSDWAQFGTTKQASDKTIASFSVDGSYNTMALNATGLAAINKTGITKYGFTFTSLIDNSEPSWVSDNVSVLSVQSALGANPPQLVVTYTPSGNADTHTKGSGADVQIFTTTGSSRTWVKPSWATTVYMEVIGAGGSGGGGDGSGRSGGGGGGGAFARGIYDAKSIPASLTIAVGAGSNGGAGGSSGNVGVIGVAGGNTTVTGGTFTLSAFGGGAGYFGNAAGTNGGGGGGGGTATVGVVGAAGTGGDGGGPTIQGSAVGTSAGGRGGQGGDAQDAGWAAEYGGGGAGGGGGAVGGSSIFGAGGGAGSDGAAGGVWGSYTAGGGQAAGNPPNDSISRTYGCGDGGSSANVGGGAGIAGGTPGGGGAGGTGADSATGGTGGAGADGAVRIYSW